MLYGGTVVNLCFLYIPYLGSHTTWTKITCPYQFCTVHTAQLITSLVLLRLLHCRLSKEEIRFEKPRPDLSHKTPRLAKLASRELTLSIGVRHACRPSSSASKGSSNPCMRTLTGPSRAAWYHQNSHNSTMVKWDIEHEQWCMHAIYERSQCKLNSCTSCKFR